MSEIAELFKQSVPDPDLVFWTMGGMTDLSRFRHVLTKNGDVVCGHQMGFDGTGDFISLPAAVRAYLVTAEDYTVAMLARIDNIGVNDRTLFSSFNGAADGMGIALQQVTSEIRVGHYSGVYAAMSESYPIAGYTVHVAMVKESGVVTGYLNGVVMTGANAPSLTVGVACNIGARTDGSNAMIGVERDLRVYKAAKSAQWVGELYTRLKRAV